MSGNPPIPDEVRSRIVSLLRGGHTIAKIAELTGVHQSTVMDMRYKLGLVKNKKKYTYLSKKKVLDILRDIEKIDRKIHRDDIKQLSKLHDVSEKNLRKVLQEGLGAISSMRQRVKPRQIQVIYEELKNGERPIQVIKKASIPRKSFDYYKRRFERGKDIRTCAAPDCENTFIPRLDGKPKLYCSTRCRDREKQRRYRTLREKKNQCPQCGNDWVEPVQTHRGKPKHCLNCQQYYHERYEESREER